MKRRSIMVIAGEISGDMHAAALVRAIQAQGHDLGFFGIGGAELRQTGMEILVDTREMAVLGLTDVLRKYFFFRSVFNRMLKLAAERRPDAVLLVDYPGFNLRFAKRVQALGLKVIYYICPQVWAWNRRRIPALARSVNRLLAIFPFEAEVFKGAGLPVDFVGHPLVTAAEATRQEPAADLPWDGELRVALLPGSRYHEVLRILPVMLAAAVRLERQFPGIAFIIAAPADNVSEWVRKIFDQCGGPKPARCAVVSGRTRQILLQARAALVTSGTATVEAALMRCPMIVTYKTAWATYCLGHMLIRVPYLGMINIIAGRSICPEFIQAAATPAALADALTPLLKDDARRAAMLNGLDAVCVALGPAGAEKRAADVVLREIGVGAAG